MDAGILQAIQHEVQNAIKESQDQLLNSLSTLLDKRLDGVQRNIQENQKMLSDTQMAKMDETMADTYKFKKRGNEEQFKHNQKVFTKIQEANTQMETDNLNEDQVLTAKRRISEGLELIRSRQKHIKLADSSEAGWRVVDEYVSNPLAEVSDDEKRIYKAQSRAESKMKKEKAKRRVDQRQTPYKKPATFNQIPTRIQSTFRPGRCFNCDEMGHWRRECPLATVGTTKDKICKIFNFSQDSNTPQVKVQMSHDTNTSGNTHTINNSKRVHSSETFQSPVGRLFESVDKWKEICANEHIIDVIENGYKIPFLTLPDRVELDNNKSARDNSEFVSSEITKLLSKGCISKVNTKPFVINPLTVAHNKGSKLRLVLDARHINPHLFKFRYKYEDAVTARQMFKKSDYIFSYDLKSA